MIQSFRQRFMNLSIRKKTTLSMAVLALGVALGVGVLCSVSYVRQFTAQARGQSQETISTTVHSLQTDLNAVYRAATYLLSDAVFSEVFHASANPEGDKDFLVHYQQMQPLFTYVMRSNTLVDHVVLLCENGKIYSTYEAGLNYTRDDFAQEYNQTKIAWLPARKSPLRGAMGTVIPVCFPISYTPMLSFSNGEPSSMVLVLYLNADKMALNLERMNRTAFSRGYLADETGMPLNLHSADPLFAAVMQPGFSAGVAQAPSGVQYHTTLGGQAYGVTVQDLGISGLRFVSAVSYAQMLQGVRQILWATVLAVLLAFLAAVLIAQALSRTLTTPISHLLGQVHKIRSGNLQLAPVTRYRDEMHTLDEALCEMSGTISAQMDAIRTEETQRRKAEMDALTEQINPHFLYNTLDCIHWEILSSQTQTAADMVESLGVFLRLSLNRGSDILTLKEALEHARQYVNIMNCRLESHIAFSFHLPQELENWRLPKMIVQPLVENCILHGFGTQQEFAGTAPEIEVEISATADAVVLVVQDNGKGIDVQRARECVQKNAQETNHVGLSNVYHRLVYHFGPQVEIDFASIPYYKNSVTLTLPRR